MASTMVNLLTRLVPMNDFDKLSIKKWVLVIRDPKQHKDESEFM
jgi:hypothetical protein